MSTPKLESLLTPDLTAGLLAVEEHLRATLETDVSLLKEIPSYLLSLGGKRIRPALTILCAKLLGHRELTADLLNISAGIELIHMATLLHDDIIDKAPTRRKKISAYKKFGESNTLLAGNYLFVKAFGLCAKLDPFIIRETEKACVELTEGEIMEGISDFSVDSALEIARRKTGSLFRLAVLSGGFVASNDIALSLKMGEFGEALGVAFQISDDILDVTSTAEILGKEIGGDIKEQKPSIVNCLWKESGSPFADAILGGGPCADEGIATAIAEITSGPIVVKARALGNQYVKKASDCLTEIRSCRPDLNGNLFETVSTIIEFAAHRLN